MHPYKTVALTELDMKTSHLLKTLLNLRFARILEWFLIALGNSTEATAL